MLFDRSGRRRASPAAPPTGAAPVRLGLRFPRRGRGRWFGLAIDVVWPVLALGTRLRLSGADRLPREGGVLVAANHLSNLDPVVLTAFCLAGGRVPRFLAKAGLWRVPVVRAVMASGGHIPVRREATSAREAYLAYQRAVGAVREGEAVVVFPEGGFPERADGWPGPGKAGLVRIALATGAPVVPVAVWGTQRVLPRGGRRLPRVVPRRTVHVVAGPPVNLADLAGSRPTAAAVAEATRRVMAAITQCVAEVRGERPPALREG
ncbi:1-acyl-sn-glycerol-3-phosphate acyltransferases [Amycolatopsis arida]|uniref:1-acyl-sn-glycerol-3-phosphate acyltransferases n=1 Tax=Amycolatopsis arida TaxID=587909 RepID=A0A1I5KTY5_9PSEU|nr:lysophospholipid acyltransferase family protein [Amycolatopsis arida]TDX85840.1 1-acyl-sn-glycerol-3-phosphate acyltransferase [Amycolatopsis arida]SFO88494.1 1-acyl-sn-glycerol-3-phosphate acyltransferases [Amycolatopsis arida]